MKKKLYFGSNFKMYKNINETKKYLQEITEATKEVDRNQVQFFFIPSYTSLESASKMEIRNQFMLGAQNMCWESEGQFTGEISPEMLRELGVELVMIGHSERRYKFHESDHMENQKVKKALEYGFTTLLAVGETAEEKMYGISQETVRSQLKKDLYGVTSDQIAQYLWIAYEPVWAIGVHGTAAPVEYAATMHRTIRECLVELFGKAGEEVPLLYGGSVNPGNASELLSQTDINGLFTTRTAFQVECFAGMIKKAIQENIF